MNYSPTKGFCDLSVKPKKLSKRDHERVQKLQMDLVKIEERKKQYMKDKINWTIAQQMSAKLQQVILSNYKE